MATLSTFGLLLLLAQHGHAAMGPAFSTGPVGSGSWIRDASSTLVVPEAPEVSVGDTVLWTGMGTDLGDLIQAINHNFPPNDLGSTCSNLGGDWCVAASTLVKTSDTTQEQQSGPEAVSKSGDEITMHYVFNNSTQMYDQQALINGEVVSELSTSEGHKAMGWGTSVECTTKPCGLVPAHTWIKTTITLDTPDPNYISTNFKGEGVTGEMVTNDGGLTWTVDEIYIPEWLNEEL